MNFLQALRQVLSKYADFSGWARRSELWWWMLAITVASAALSGSTPPSVSIPPIDVRPTGSRPNLAVGTRRLHRALYHSGGNPLRSAG